MGWSCRVRHFQHTQAAEGVYNPNQESAAKSRGKNSNDSSNHCGFDPDSVLFVGQRGTTQSPVRSGLLRRCAEHRQLSGRQRLSVFTADVDADNTITECFMATEPVCRDSEMSYMNWQNHVTPFSPSPFANVLPHYYRCGSESAPNTISARAVRPGDIARVPVPAAARLLGWIRRKSIS